MLALDLGLSRRHGDPPGLQPGRAPPCRGSSPALSRRGGGWSGSGAQAGPGAVPRGLAVHLGGTMARRLAPGRQLGPAGPWASPASAAAQQGWGDPAVTASPGQHQHQGLRPPRTAIQSWGVLLIWSEPWGTGGVAPGAGPAGNEHSALSSAAKSTHGLPRALGASSGSGLQLQTFSLLHLSRPQPLSLTFPPPSWPSVPSSLLSGSREDSREQ